MGEKGDHGQIADKPASIEVDMEGDRGVERQRKSMLLAKQTDYRRVLKRVAGIFARGDIGVQISFGYGNP